MESDVTGIEAGGGLSYGCCDGDTSELRVLKEEWMWEELDAHKAGWELFPLLQFVLQKASPCPVLLAEGP